MCGEHQLLSSDQTSIEGSSPRVRGTRCSFRRGTRTIGIIPACAGNTVLLCGHFLLLRDHPRVCGEHSGLSSAPNAPDRSSPRVRGTQNIEIIDNLADGIIPACAGNTGGWQLLVGRHGDHPRVCGEHPRSSSLTMPPAGSSPRVRGTLHVHDVRGGLRGIIPACAGNTTGSFPPAWCRWDHPRVCGEHVFTIPGHIPAWGSSPRVRGTLPTHVGMIP